MMYPRIDVRQIIVDCRWQSNRNRHIVRCDNYISGVYGAATSQISVAADINPALRIDRFIWGLIRRALHVIEKLIVFISASAVGIDANARNGRGIGQARYAVAAAALEICAKRCSA